LCSKIIQMSVNLLKKYSFVVGFCFLIVGCKPEVSEVKPTADFNPEISEPTMIKILTDVHIAEGLIQMTKGSKKDSISNISYQRIYEHYNIDEEKFDNNLKQYLNQPFIADRIYKEVLENLTKLETKPSSNNKNMKKAIESIDSNK